VCFFGSSVVSGTSIEFVLADPLSSDAQAAMSSYFAELNVRFPSGFDPGDALTADPVAFQAPQGAFVIVRDGAAVVGCGGIQRVDKATGEIKRMWIHADSRGIGLGRRLLDHLEVVAAQLGYTRVVLDTNASLKVAIAMYEGAGYQAIERYNDNPYAQRWFAKTLACGPWGVDR
jgi:ribosomal protein S18 acetylase RimI-like enzyme